MRDEKKREMMSDEMSRSRRVSRLEYFSCCQAESCHLRQIRRRCNSPRSNSALISPASSTTLLNLIRASSSRALASLLHHRLEPPVSHRQRQRSPPQPELPARNSTISTVRCVRGATDLASQSARTVHALQKVPTTTHVPPFHYQISRRRVTLSPWRALLCSQPSTTEPEYRRWRARRAVRQFDSVPGSAAAAPTAHALYSPAVRRRACCIGLYPL